jgi:hypothetical protein
MPRQFNYTRAAAALVEAQLKSDAEVAAAFGVSVRSLETWRVRLSWDEALQVEYKRMAKGKLETWVSKIPDCLDGAIAFITRATTEADPKDPDAVRAITGAIATLNEVGIIQEAIQQRKAKLNE